MASWVDLEKHIEKILNLSLKERGVYFSSTSVNSRTTISELAKIIFSSDLSNDSEIDIETKYLSKLLRQIEVHTNEWDGSIPEFLDNFKIIKLIGKGGMGSVYLSEQQKPKRLVALKILSNASTRNSRIRFEMEQQALAQLRHPNIAQLYSSGMESDIAYFAMEYIEGTPITEYCDTHILTIKERIGVFVQICAALVHAHQKGVIHRDLKPDNILISNIGVHQVKLIDFGISKNSNNINSEVIKTRHGQFLGTPSYMSPEQAEGDVDKIDTRTDIYALGTILYELITGEMFLKTNLLKDVPLLKIGKIIRENNPLPLIDVLNSPNSMNIAHKRGTTVSQLKSNLCGDIERIIEKCTQSDINLRYNSVIELKNDIVRLLENKPISATKPTFSYKLKKFLSRNKAAASWSTLLATATTLWIASSIFLIKETEKEKASTLYAENLSERRLKESDTLNSLLGEIISSSHPNNQGVDVRVKDLMEELESRAKEQHGNDSRMYAKIQTQLGNAYFGLGNFQKAEKCLTSALAIYKNSEPRSKETSAVIKTLSSLYMEQGQFEKSRCLFDELDRETTNPKERNTIDDNLFRAILQKKSGHHKNATKEYLEIIVSLEEKGLRNSEIYAQTLGGLADNLAIQGETELAEAIFLEAHQVFHGIQSKTKTPYFAFLNNWGHLLNKMNRYQEAIPIFQEALLGYDAVQSRKHPDSSSVLTGLALAMGSLGDDDSLKEALTYAEVAYHNRYLSTGPTHHLTIAAANNYAILCYKAGELERAKQILEEVVTYHPFRQNKPPKPLLQALNNLSYFMLSEGYWSQAEELQWLALHGFQSQAIDQKDPSLVNAELTMIEIWLKGKRYDSAISLLDSLKNALTQGMEGALKHEDSIDRLYNQILEMNCLQKK